MRHLSQASRTMIYVIGHFVAAMIGVIVSYIWWHNKLLNKLALSLLFMTAISNGGKLYSRRYSHVVLELPNLTLMKEKRKSRN